MKTYLVSKKRKRRPGNLVPGVNIPGGDIQVFRRTFVTKEDAMECCQESAVRSNPNILSLGWTLWRKRTPLVSWRSETEGFVYYVYENDLVYRDENGDWADVILL